MSTSNWLATAANLQYSLPMVSRIHVNTDLTTIINMKLNPYAAEFFQTIFNSFEAGIANAISSSKWRKINKNIHL